MDIIRRLQKRECRLPTGNRAFHVESAQVGKAKRIVGAGTKIRILSLETQCESLLGNVNSAFGLSRMAIGLGEHRHDIAL